MGDSIGIAMVGCGQIAEAHLKGVAAVAGARLAFCMDADAGRAESAAARYGGARWGVNYGEVLQDAGVDAVVLCLPHDLHLPFTVQAAQAGKHILVEKPMALNEAEARQMVAAADRAGVQLSVGQSTRYQAAFQEAKKALESGRIGRVIQVVHQRLFWIEKLSTDWRRSAACGGLYLPLFGSHDVDAMLWLLDDQPVRVWGHILAHSHVSEGDSDGFIGLAFADGKLGSLSFSVQCKHARTETVFVGEAGALAVQRNALLLDGEELILPGGAEGAFVLQMRRFVEALLAGRKTPVQGREVLRVMRTLDLARQSSETGAPQAF